MDSLVPELINAFVAAALEGDDNARSRQRARLLAFGLVNKHWHAALNVCNATELAIRHGCQKRCPAISAESPVKRLEIIWSDKEYCRLQYGAPRAESLAGKEGYDLALQRNLEELTLWVKEASDAEPYTRITNYLLAKPQLLVGLKSLRLIGKVEWPTEQLLSLLQHCLRLEYLAIAPTWPYYPSPMPQRQPSARAQPWKTFKDYDRPVALPFKLRRAVIVGTGNLVNWLLGPAVAEEEATEGLVQDCDLTIECSGLLTHESIREQVKHIARLRITVPLIESRLGAYFGHFERTRYLDLCSIDDYQLGNLLSRFPVLKHLRIRHLVGPIALQTRIDQVPTLKKLEMPDRWSEANFAGATICSYAQEDKRRIEELCSNRSIELSWR